MATQTIYARVPATVKEAADAYADQRGLTLTAAVTELLDRGLSAVSEEQSIRALEQNVAEMKVTIANLEGDLARARGALTGVEERTQQPVATCPSCGERVTGFDLLVAGRCPKCKSGLGDVLPGGKATSKLDDREFLLLLAALGAVLGVAYIATKS